MASRKMNLQTTVKNKISLSAALFFFVLAAIATTLLVGCNDDRPHGLGLRSPFAGVWIEKNNIAEYRRTQNAAVLCDDRGRGRDRKQQLKIDGLVISDVGVVYKLDAYNWTGDTLYKVRSDGRAYDYGVLRIEDCRYCDDVNDVMIELIDDDVMRTQFRYNDYYGRTRMKKTTYVRSDDEEIENLRTAYERRCR